MPRPGWGAEAPPAPHVWVTLGFRGVDEGEGFTAIEWDATPEFCFPTPQGPVVHGGLVATLLDTAMGGACWTLLENDESFLTADLRVEFLRSARPGTLRADGRVLRRSRGVAFCAADLYDAEGVALASSRCTQIIRR